MLNKIYLSPGHFGKGTGASSIYGDEFLLSEEIVKEMKPLLILNNVQTYSFTDKESKNQNQNLGRIVKEHNKVKVDFHLSIHFNSMAGGITESGKGSEVWYSTALKEAQIISEAISKCLNVKNRGAKKGNFYFLKNTIGKALIIETVFTNSTYDMQQLKKVGIKKLALEIVRAIIEKIYGRKFIEPSGNTTAPINEYVIEVNSPDGILNLRTQPNHKAPILKVLKNKERYKAYGTAPSTTEQKNNKWLKVGSGYCNSRYVKVIK